MRRYLRWLPFIPAAAMLVLALAAPAGASTTTMNWEVTTHMTNRLDSGGNGNWAVDNFYRHAHLHEFGKVTGTDCGLAPTSACFAYTMVLDDDSGTFKTIPDAFTPNQGLDPGEHIADVDTGTFYGSGGFGTFYASERPAPGGVPTHVSGNTVSSSDWPRLFFRDSTVIVGVSENTFGYFYTAGSQHWADTGTNGDGQNNGDGDITT